MLLIQLILFNSYRTWPPSHSILFFNTILLGTLFPLLAVLSHSHDIVSLDLSPITFGYSLCHFYFFHPEKLVALKGSTVDSVLCSWLACLLHGFSCPHTMIFGFRSAAQTSLPSFWLGTSNCSPSLGWANASETNVSTMELATLSSLLLPTSPQQIGHSFWVARLEEWYNPARPLILRNLTKTGTRDPFFSFYLVSEQSLCLI